MASGAGHVLRRADTLADVDLSGWMPANTYVRYTMKGVTVRIIEVPSVAFPNEPGWTVKVGGTVDYHALELRVAVMRADRIAEEDHGGWVVVSGEAVSNEPHGDT